MLGSTWLLLPLLGCGFLSFAGFLYVAARTKERWYWILATLYGVIGLAAVTLMQQGASGSTVEGTGVAILLGGWAANVAHAFAVNPDYLRWKARVEGFGALPRPAAIPIPQDNRHDGAYDGWPERDELPVIAAPPWEPVFELVDVNTADALTLAGLPGLDASTARRIINARTAYGPFDSLEEVAALAPLRPSTVAALRPWITVGPPV